MGSFIVKFIFDETPDGVGINEKKGGGGEFEQLGRLLSVFEKTEPQHVVSNIQR